MPQVCYYISGRVQGVWFRESTRLKATRLGLTGTATNLEDGRVRVQAEGTEAALAEIEAWLQHGPPMAKVSQVVPGTISFDSVEDFTATELDRWGQSKKPEV
jgi:acylphosphatase